MTCTYPEEFGCKRWITDGCKLFTSIGLDPPVRPQVPSSSAVLVVPLQFRAWNRRREGCCAFFLLARSVTTIPIKRQIMLHMFRKQMVTVVDTYIVYLSNRFVHRRK